MAGPGVKIPRFCYHDKLFIAGNCLMCSVELGNAPKPQASCALLFMPNMIICTNTALVRKAQEFVLAGNIIKKTYNNYKGMSTKGPF